MQDPEGDKLPRPGPVDLASILEFSPCVAITWCNRAGWPVDYVSANFRQFGYEGAELVSGRLNYRSLIHPDDLARIEPELQALIAHGPDQYRERYRLRHGAGHWIWVDGYSWLVRDEAQGRTLESLIIPPAMREQVARGIDAWASGGPAVPPGELVLQDKYGNPVSVYSSQVMRSTAAGGAAAGSVCQRRGHLLSAKYRGHRGGSASAPVRPGHVPGQARRQEPVSPVRCRV